MGCNVFVVARRVFVTNNSYKKGPRRVGEEEQDAQGRPVGTADDRDHDHALALPASAQSRRHGIGQAPAHRRHWSDRCQRRGSFCCFALTQNLNGPLQLRTGHRKSYVAWERCERVRLQSYSITPHTSKYAPSTLTLRMNNDVL